MAKKPKAPEHENLERWMVSYADFVTLLFATFVVLYALAQVDAKDFEALAQSIREAFSAPSIMQGAEGILDSSAGSMLDAMQGDSVIAPLMMEYMNAKYEEQSMNEIMRQIENAKAAGELDDVEAEKTDRGLVIRFKDDCLFKPGSAELTPKAKVQLDVVGVMILKKFVIHYTRVEGHSDNMPIFSPTYPSNWELSSARSSAVVRYFIDRFKFMPKLFTVVGFADTRPIASNNTPEGQEKNRRVEILILKNRYKDSETKENIVAKMSKEEQEKLQEQRQKTINRIGEISEAARNLANGNKEAEKNAVILNKIYNKEIQRITHEAKALDQKERQKMTGEGDWLRPKSTQVKEELNPFKDKKK